MLVVSDSQSLQGDSILTQAGFSRENRLMKAMCFLGIRGLTSFPPDPETPVRAPETWFNGRTMHDFELLTKRRDLKQPVAASRGCASK
jgi:hypothetical protein